MAQRPAQKSLEASCSGYVSGPITLRRDQTSDRKWARPEPEDQLGSRKRAIMRPEQRKSGNSLLISSSRDMRGESPNEGTCGAAAKFPADIFSYAFTNARDGYYIRKENSRPIP
jgi:hypothetical protein